MKKNAKLEFIKSKEEVDFIAKLLIELCKDNKEQYIFLKGDIGSGKTYLVKKIAKELGEKTNVVSPTFNKMIVYDDFVHIDAYNLKNQNLKSFEDYFENKIVIIEWAHLLDEKFSNGYEINIEFVDETKRKYTIIWKD